MLPAHRQGKPWRSAGSGGVCLPFVLVCLERRHHWLVETSTRIRDNEESRDAQRNLPPNSLIHLLHSQSHGSCRLAAGRPAGGFDVQAPPAAAADLRHCHVGSSHGRLRAHLHAAGDCASAAGELPHAVHRARWARLGYLAARCVCVCVCVCLFVCVCSRLTR